MNALFLIQIPHTKGTSARLAACRHWGSGKIVCDHGAGNRHTTPVVEELVYLEKDYHLFKEYLEQNNIALFTSTQPLRQLRRIFPVSHMVTFVRDPVERLLQHYQQARSAGTTQSSLLDFCARSENRNLQSRYLRQIPLELYGFVGLSERYADSLRLLNAQFNCELTELKTPGKNKPGKSKTQPGAPDCPLPDGKTRREILTLNQEDAELYATATELFNTRLELFEASEHYTHGKISQLTSEKISGWAVSPLDHTPCKVRVLVNNHCVGVMSAREYSGTLKERNVSRDGYVGFSYKFDKKLKPSDVVSCHIHPSDQRLSGPNKPDNQS